MDWQDYKNFSKWEFDCKHTNENEMRPEFLDILQQIRNTFGKPMQISSGYRHFTHPFERDKVKPGSHTHGCAADIKISGVDAMDLIVMAYGYGIRRIGINQRGGIEQRFIHLDIADQLGLGFPQTIWSY